MSPRMLGLIVGIASLIWCAITVYSEIIQEDPDQFSIKSARVKQQMENCTGTYEQRADCAERITDRAEQLGFLVWCEKLAIILGPPLVLWGLSGYAMRQRRDQPQPAPRAPARRVAADAAAPRRVAADMHRAPGEPMRREPTLDVPNMSEPDQGPVVGGQTPNAPIFTGGRREPVRRRDR